MFSPLSPCNCFAGSRHSSATLRRPAKVCVPVADQSHPGQASKMTLSSGLRSRVLAVATPRNRSDMEQMHLSTLGTRRHSLVPYPLPEAEKLIYRTCGIAIRLGYFYIFMDLPWPFEGQLFPLSTGPTPECRQACPWAFPFVRSLKVSVKSASPCRTAASQEGGGFFCFSRVFALIYRRAC